jgi:hypothetical protein
MTEDTQDAAPAVAPVSACGLTVNLKTARDMIAGGQHGNKVAEWLYATMRGHSEELPSVGAAIDAINGEENDA